MTEQDNVIKCYRSCASLRNSRCLKTTTKLPKFIPRYRACHNYLKALSESAFAFLTNVPRRRTPIDRDLTTPLGGDTPDRGQSDWRY